MPPAFGNGVVAFSGSGSTPGGPLTCVDGPVLDDWLHWEQKRRWNESLRSRWTNELKMVMSIAVTDNAVIAAGQSDNDSGWVVRAFNIESGKLLWNVPLSAIPIPGGLCVDRDGRVIVVLQNGNVVCVS